MTLTMVGFSVGARQGSSVDGPSLMGDEVSTGSGCRATTRTAERTLAGGARIVLSVRAGDRIEGFTLVRRLGRGGMGEVWEAEQDTPRRRVALKFFVGSGMNEQDRQRRLREEADRASRLKHPNIITIYQVGRDFPYIAQELVPGGRTLRHEREQILAERTFDGFVRWVAATTRKIADGIQAAHEQGVVHRDIKLANVLVREDGEPLVIDFGIAAVESAPAGTQTENLVGTPRCLAPEQVVEGRTGKSPSVDVYQLGLLLHDLLTGEAAFQGAHGQEVCRLIADGQFLRPRRVRAGIPYALEAVCLRAMALAPRDRYPSVAELVADLDRFLGREVPMAARGGRWLGAIRDVRAWVRRRWGLLAAPALAVALGVYLAPLPDQGAAHGLPGVDIDVYRSSAEVEPPEPVRVGDTVRIGDVLGVAVRSESPLWVYVVSVFGEREPPTWFVPVKPGGMETLSDSGTWGTWIDADGTPTECLEITEASRNVPYEGMWIFACQSEQPLLERWMWELRTAALDSPSKAVSWENASRLLEAASEVVRGEPLASSDPAWSSISSTEDDAAFDFGSIDPFEVWFRVEGAR